MDVQTKTKLIISSYSQDGKQREKCQTYQILQIFSEVLLAVSFAWGPVLLDVMQSLVLLLHVCPFDTGDRIVFRGNSA